VLVSACLLGIPCRYDGKSELNREILSSKNFMPIPVCPEQLGGLSTPRQSAYIIGGDGRDVLNKLARVVNNDGVDVTNFFIEGAMHTLDVARIVNAVCAILKDYSPSCGTNDIWTKDRKISGAGVMAAVLLENGISVMNEEGKIIHSKGIQV
jgi:uncharacterized protein YbbK (DUF523 family)